MISVSSKSRSFMILFMYSPFVVMSANLSYEKEDREGNEKALPYLKREGLLHK